MLSRALGALIVVALVHAGTLGLTSHAQGATTRASSLLIVAELNPDNPLEARFELRNAVANRVKLREWRFGDSTSSTEATPTHRYSRPDTYRVSARYVTVDGTELAISRRLNLASPPSVQISGSGSVTGGSSLAFWFAAQATTSRDRTNTRGCRWTFGDGGTASGGKVEHTFPKAGVYKVKVSFEDGAATIVSDSVEVSVVEVIPVPAPEPAPAPVPEPDPAPAPEPPPPPQPVTLSIDFETQPAGVDGVTLKMSSDAHSGVGSLSMNLLDGTALHTALSNFFLPKLLPFSLAARVDAVASLKWNATVALDATKLQPALDAYVAAHPTALTAAQQTKLKAWSSAIQAAAPALPTFAGGEWHCIGLDYTFPTSTAPGKLKLAKNATTFLELSDVSVLDDGAIIGALLDTLFGGKVVTTTATTAWLDDLKLSTDALSCP